MPIKVPIEKAYYFELTPLRKRIYCWIPKKHLEKMVQRKEVKKNILKDYPDGLDIEVSREQFEEFKNHYNLDLKVDPDSLLNAFHSLLLKMEESFPKSGYINKNYLENYARKINKDILVSKTYPHLELKKKKVIKVDKQRHRKQLTMKKKIKKYLKDFEIKKLDRKISFQEQPFSQVKMSKGEEPFDAFSKIQQSKGKER